MQVAKYPPLSRFFSGLAIREQHSEWTHPLCTYSLHNFAQVLRAGLRQPLKIPRGATRSSERHLHITQLPQRHRHPHGYVWIPAGKLLFLTHSLCSAEAALTPELTKCSRLCGSVLLAQGQADIGQQQAVSQHKIANGFLSTSAVILQHILSF